MKKDSKDKGNEPSIFFAVNNGYYTVFSGIGAMLENFVSNGTLGDFTGSNVIPKFPGDANYRKGKLRFAPFDQSFNFVGTDVDDRKCYICSDMLSY